MKGFGDGALSNFHFPNLRGSPAGARSQPHASIVFLYLSSFAMRWTVPVPMPNDLATFKIPTPFES